MKLSAEAERFLPLVKSIALQIQKELVPDLPIESLILSGIPGLSDGFAQYKSRQGLTLRSYLIYRIRAAIYDSLAGFEWKTEENRRNYLFSKKSNELLLNFHLSAEGTIKRSIQAEEEELMHLLSLLAVVALLSCSNSSGTEWKNYIQKLNIQEQHFIQYYYEQDLNLDIVSEKIGIPFLTSSRFHLKILEKLARFIGTPVT